MQNNFLLSSPSQKTEMELYKKGDYVGSAEQYRVCSDWRNAYKAYMKAFETSRDYTHLQNAGECAEKFDLKLAEECYLADPDSRVRLGDLYHRNSAYTQAIEQYEIAIFEAKDENVRQEIQLLVAKTMLYQKDFSGAAHIYQQVATEKLKRPLGKWGAYNYIFKAVLCEVLAYQDYKVLNRYEKLFPAWKETIGYKSCKNIIQAFEKKDRNMFNQAVFDLEKTFTDELVTILYELREKLKMICPMK